MSKVQAPAARPCASCPYRLDAPPGLWASEEYDKLPLYDGDTFVQPMGMFLCHQRDGRLCAGWVGCHDMAETMAVRVGALDGSLDEEAIDEVLDYSTDVALHPSGKAAAEHGKSEIETPGERARRLARGLASKGMEFD